MSADPITDTEAAAELLDAELAGSRSAVVFTGAGISTESGIPDFRSPGGVWSRMRPIEYDDFVASEEARLTDWQRRFEMARLFAQSEPNAAHLTVARLVRDGPVRTVITQNIDGLHRRAGVPDDALVEVHGTADHATCLACGARSTIEAAEAHIRDTGCTPRCSLCGGLVKAAIISFGQPMPEAAMRRAEAATLEADLFIAAGSSLVVYPAAGLPILAQRNGARLVIASREPTELDELAHACIRTPLAITFARLGAGDRVSRRQHCRPTGG